MIDIDFLPKGGQVVFDDFHLDARQPLAHQLDELKEDMLQVTFAHDRLIDVGWRPCFDPDGCFHVVLIGALDWCNPLYAGTARTLADLQLQVQAALARVPPPDRSAATPATGD